MIPSHGLAQAERNLGEPKISAGLRSQAQRYDDFVAWTHIFARETLKFATKRLIFGSFLWHSRCSNMNLMNNGASVKPVMRSYYSNALRCIGQSLEALELKAVEVRTHGENYIIQAWNKGTSIAMDLERHCGPEDLQKLEIEGKARRKTLSGPPNLLSLSQVLRLAGNYVDRLRGRLIRVSWQDQSDKIQSVTIQYEPCPVNAKEQGDSQMTVIEEVCVHIYKQRKKIAAAQDKNTHRPFVSVNNMN